MRLALNCMMCIIFLLFAGCASSNNATNGKDKLTVTKASYQDWTGRSPVPDGGLERGTDLLIYLEGWPSGQSPDFVIFRGKKSFPARIQETDNHQVKIHARIVHESGILMEVSETTDLSDRLVFTKPGGEHGFVHIEDWEWIEG